MSGGILDLAWGPESKRMIVGGDGGKSHHAKVFMAETGSGQGEITGNTKPVQAVDFRPSKPYRTVVGSQDFKVSIYNGPPFKFNKSHSEHKNFVTSVQYSPKGDVVASCAGKSLVLADGEELAVKSTFPEEHKGTIYGCAFSKDGSKILTCSADKTVKLWDVASAKCESTISIGSGTVNDMAVACVYGKANDQIVVASLEGSLHYVDASSGKVSQVVEAHTQIPSCLSCDVESGTSDLYIGCEGGQVARYDNEGHGHVARGSGHDSNCNGISARGGVTHTAGWDDKIYNVEKDSFTSSVPIGGQPQSVSSSASTSPEICATVTTNKVMLIKNGSEVVSEKSLGKLEGTCVGLAPDHTSVAVGHSKKEVVVYKVENGAIGDVLHTFEKIKGKPTVVVYSPDARYIAVGDSMKNINLYEAKSGERLDKDRWVFHQSSITDLSFSPNSQFLASGSIDCQVYLWNCEKPMKKIKINRASPGGVTGVAWISDDVVAVTGADRCIRKFKVDDWKKLGKE